MKDGEMTREEELEEALKDAFFYLELHQKECKEKKIDCDPTDWAWNVKSMLRSRLGHDHSGSAGWGCAFVFKVWLVIEVWKDGKIIPRCVTNTSGRAEYVKDRLLHSYESTEPKDRPTISIEHQRMDHIFGLSMERKRLTKYQGLENRWGK